MQISEVQVTMVCRILGMICKIYDFFLTAKGARIFDMLGFIKNAKFAKLYLKNNFANLA